MTNECNLGECPLIILEVACCKHGTQAMHIANPEDFDTEAAFKQYISNLFDADGGQFLPTLVYLRDSEAEKLPNFVPGTAKEEANANDAPHESDRAAIR